MKNTKTHSKYVLCIYCVFTCGKKKKKIVFSFFIPIYDVKWWKSEVFLERENWRKWRALGKYEGNNHGSTVFYTVIDAEKLLEEAQTVTLTEWQCHFVRILQAVEAYNTTRRGHVAKFIKDSLVALDTKAIGEVKAIKKVFLSSFSLIF